MDKPTRETNPGADLVLCPCGKPTASRLCPTCPALLGEGCSPRYAPIDENGWHPARYCPICKGARYTTPAEAAQGMLLGLDEPLDLDFRIPAEPPLGLDCRCTLPAEKDHA